MVKRFQLMMIFLNFGFSCGQHFNLTIGLLIEAPIDGQKDVAERAAHLAYLLHACDLQPITIETFVVNPDQPLHLVFQLRDFLSKPMTGFISHVSCGTLSILNTQPIACEMLHLAIVSPRCTKADYDIRDCNTFSLRERGHYILEAIVDLLQHLDWTQVVVFADNATTETRTLALFRMLSAQFIRVKPYRLREDINQTMAAFRRDVTSLPSHKVPTEFLLFLTPKMALDVLEAAGRLNLLNRKTFWILASYDTKVNAFFDNSTILSHLNESNILMLRKTWNRHQKNRCSNYQIVVKPRLSLLEAYIADAVMMFANTVAAVLRRRSFDFPENRLSFKDQLSWEIRKRNSTGLFISTAFDDTGFSSNTDYEMSSVFFMAHNGVDHVVEKKVASWNRENRLKVSEDLFPNRQIGFGGIKFKVGIFLVEPYTMMKNNNYSGLCIAILDELAKKLNFKYDLVRSPDHASGTKQPDGSWNGLIGMTMQNEVNFSIGPFTMTKKREEAVDFTMPYAEEKRGVLVKRETPSSKDAFRVIRPFSAQLWFSLCATFVFVAIILSIINKLKPDIVLYDHQIPDRDDPRFKENLWLIISHYMQQGPSMNPRTIPARLVVGFWWLFTILVSTYYTAILASSLTIPFNSNPINNIKELANPGCPFKVITLHDSSTYEDYQTSSIDWYQQIFTRIQQSPQVTNSSFALQLVMRGDYAFIGMMSQLEYLKKNHCDRLTIILDNGHISRVGFIFPNASKFKHTFSQTIMKMQEAGLIEKWQKTWWSDKIQCSNRIPKKEALSLPNVAGPYYVFLCFVLVGVLCLAFEALVKRCKKRRRNERRRTVDDSDRR